MNCQLSTSWSNILPNRKVRSVFVWVNVYVSYLQPREVESSLCVFVCMSLDIVCGLLFVWSYGKGSWCVCV